jgi:hypothetical protein
VAIYVQILVGRGGGVTIICAKAGSQNSSERKLSQFGLDYPSTNPTDKTQLRVELRKMKASAAIRLSLMASGSRFRYLVGSLRVIGEVKRVCMLTRWVDIIWTYLQIRSVKVAPSLLSLSLLLVITVCTKRSPSGSRVSASAEPRCCFVRWVS